MTVDQSKLPSVSVIIPALNEQGNFIRLPFFTSMHRYLPMLFRVYGFETAVRPVNDRPRMAGVSKYTNFGRLMIAIYDLIGVIWLRRRTKIPQIAMDTGLAARHWPLDDGAQHHTAPPEVASPLRHTQRKQTAVNGWAD